MASSRIFAPAALALAFAACTQSQERELTRWLKVEIVRPVGGSGGVIVLGQAKEVFHVKDGSRWKKLGSGHPSRYKILHDANKEYHEPGTQPAVLLDLNDGKGFQIVQEKDLTLRPLKEVFAGSTGALSVTPTASSLDFLSCEEPAAGATCRDVRIDRYHLGGALTKTFTVSLGETYPDCRVATIRYYDATSETPILYADCRPPSEHRCVWLVPKPEGLVARPVGTDRPPIDCSDPKGLKVSLIEPPKVEVLW